MAFVYIENTCKIGFLFILAVICFGEQVKPAKPVKQQTSITNFTFNYSLTTHKHIHTYTQTQIHTLQPNQKTSSSYIMFMCECKCLVTHLRVKIYWGMTLILSGKSVSIHVRMSKLSWNANLVAGAETLRHLFATVIFSFFSAETKNAYFYSYSAIDALLLNNLF